MVRASLVGRDTLSRLFLARHGDTEFNSTRRFQGHSNIELSVTGYKQVERLCQRLATEKIDRIYSSDLRRALTAAEMIADKHNLDVIACPELREINYGKLEGLTFDEISRLYPEVAALFGDRSLELKFPDGESVDDLNQRLIKFLGRLEPHTAEETILIVAHSGPLRLMLCLLLGLDLCHWRQFSIDLASLSMVDRNAGLTRISLLNDTSHLKGIGD